MLRKVGLNKFYGETTTINQPLFRSNLRQDCAVAAIDRWVHQESISRRIVFVDNSSFSVVSRTDHVSNLEGSLSTKKLKCFKHKFTWFYLHKTGFRPISWQQHTTQICFRLLKGVNACTYVWMPANAYECLWKRAIVLVRFCTQYKCFWRAVQKSVAFF